MSFFYPIAEALEPVAVSNWPLNIEGYDLEGKLGDGGNAIVYKGFCKTRKEKCAIKRISIATLFERMEAFEEVKIMRACNHENILKYYSSFVVGLELWLVTNIADRGSLYDITNDILLKKGCPNGVFDEKTIATILKEVLKGLKYLHNSGLIHRDIKDENILLSRDGTVQIADFGLTTRISSGRDPSQSKSIRGLAGTPCWMAPEVMENRFGYGFKADIWSFGILGIVMVTGNVRYNAYSPKDIFRLTLENDPPTIDSFYSDSKKRFKRYGKNLRNMIAACLQKNPKERPTADKLLDHPFFKKAKDKKFLVKTLSKQLSPEYLANLDN